MPVGDTAAADKGQFQFPHSQSVPFLSEVVFPLSHFLAEGAPDGTADAVEGGLRDPAVSTGYCRQGAASVVPIVAPSLLSGNTELLHDWVEIVTVLSFAGPQEALQISGNIVWKRKRAKGNL